MIKFFRKIRQRLVTENKPALPAGRFSKYLLYAVGEIVLVVIGILIALSINNWNETKKKELIEKEYYSNILNDLILDHEYIVSFIEILSNRQDLHYQLYDIIKTKKNLDTVVTLSQLLFTNKFEPNTSRNQTSIIDMVTSNEVRVVLNNYIREENIAIAGTESVRSFTQNNVRSYMYSKKAINIDSIFIKSRYDNRDMISSGLINYTILSTNFDDYEFKTVLMGLRMTTSSAIKNLHDLLEKNQAFQELLKKKLE